MEPPQAVAEPTEPTEPGEPAQAEPYDPSTAWQRWRDSAGRAQCRAKSQQTQQRCERPAMPGTTVCRHHGGGAPQTRRKAALRLIELVDPAIATLAKLMQDPQVSPGVRVRAAENVLDRAGFPRTVNATGTEDARELLVARLAALGAGPTDGDVDGEAEPVGAHHLGLTVIEGTVDEHGPLPE